MLIIRETFPPYDPLLTSFYYTLFLQKKLSYNIILLRLTSRSVLLFKTEFPVLSSFNPFLTNRMKLFE